MPEDKSHSSTRRPSPRRTARIEQLTDDELRDLLAEMTAALAPTTSATFIESLRTLTPADLRALLLELAADLDPPADTG